MPRSYLGMCPKSFSVFTSSKTIGILPHSRRKSSLHRAAFALPRRSARARGVAAVRRCPPDRQTRSIHAISSLTSAPRPVSSHPTPISRVAHSRAPAALNTVRCCEHATARPTSYALVAGTMLLLVSSALAVLPATSSPPSSAPLTTSINQLRLGKLGISSDADCARDASGYDSRAHEDSDSLLDFSGEGKQRCADRSFDAPISTVKADDIEKGKEPHQYAVGDSRCVEQVCVRDCMGARRVTDALPCRSAIVAPCSACEATAMGRAPRRPEHPPGHGSY